MKFIIIGGGIGGLTSAIALNKKGFDASVYEAAPEFKTVGAGIILGNNAMNIFKELGIDAEIIEKGNPLSKNVITDAQLKTLQEVETVGTTICIHRAILQDILVTNIDSGKLHFEKKYLSHQYNTSKKTVLAQFDDEEFAEGNYLIGADGIHSKVRQQFNPRVALRNAGQICWRGVCDVDLPEKYQYQLTEAWGGTNRFGIVSYAPRKVYWYAVHEGTEKKSSKILDLFNNFNPLVQKIISSTEERSIHSDRISDIHPVDYNWSNGFLCLIGDAAHATTPNLGQGACQAIEDAYALSLALEKYVEVELAFEQFQKVRQAKVKFIVNTSWSVGQMAHWSHPLAMRFRNSMMRLVPSSAGKQRFQKVYDLKYLNDI